MSAPIQWTIDDAQMLARTSLKILDELVGVLLQTGTSSEEDMMLSSLEESREELARACQILEYLNPNGVMNRRNLQKQAPNPNGAITN